MSPLSAQALPFRPHAAGYALVVLALTLLCLTPRPAHLAAADGPARVLLPHVSVSRPPRLVFARWEENGGFSRHTIRADGSGLATLLGPGQPTPYDAVWSPDGRRIAMIERYTIGGVWHQSLWVMELDGFARRRLTDDTLNVYRVDWSPDGRTLVAATSQIGDMRTSATLFYTIRLEDAAMTKLTSAAGSNLDLGWSPDGRWIAFSMLAQDGASLQVIAPDGTEKRTLVTIPGAPIPSMAWSPDSSWIAYMGESGPLGGYKLYRVRADGTGRQELAADFLYTRPSWSPDGRSLAALKLTDTGYPQLVAVDADDGATRVLLVPNPANSEAIWGPTWSPSGDMVAFCLYIDSQEQLIAVVGADGKNFRTLTPGDQPVWLR